MSKFNPQPRRLARRYTLQALYQWLLSGNDLIDIERNFLNDYDMSNVDTEYFHELLHQIPQQLTDIDAAFTPHIDRKFKELNPIELCILRMGTYELLKRLDIPYKVVINEEVQLAKKFGAEEGFKFVNGVLDKVAREQRKNEI